MHRFYFAVAHTGIFNQSDTRVNPITIYSLNGHIKMFFEVCSFASSIISRFFVITTY